MQLLSFTAGGQTYAIEAAAVVEVLPAVPVRPLPHVPDYVLGVVAYRGRMIPVIDVPRRLAGEAARQRLSTRLIVVEPPGEGGPLPSLLGLVVENMVATVRAEDAETVFPAMHLESARYLGKILRLRGQTIQMLVVEHLLPAGLATGQVVDVARPETP